ncbi:MAG: signal peptidase I [Clostridia bacterium]|nr:signal peptidase I [Clostridia bacterium]
MGKKKILREILEWAAYISAAIAISLLITAYVGQKTIVYGKSMEPTLHDGNQLWIEKITKNFGKFDRGDIVTIHVPEVIGEEKDAIIKRVIGIEGDRIEIKDGKVYVNGEVLKEDYINGNYTKAEANEYSNLTVPKGHIYVLGDNRDPGASLDSRYLGPIDVKKVIGKATIRVYPFNELGTVK